jgi:hypothetical protein
MKKNGGGESHKLHNLISFPKWQGNISKEDRIGQDSTCGFPGGNEEYIHRPLSKNLTRRNSLLDQDINGEK